MRFVRSLFRKIVFSPRWLVIWLIDRYLLWTAEWDEHRDDAIRRLEERRNRQDVQIDMLREQHDREVRRLKEELLIAGEQIKLLTADNQKFFEIIERDRKIIARQGEDAGHRPPQAGMTGQFPFPQQY